MTLKTGQCLCGNITYKFDVDPIMTGVCHCKNCQRQAGSAFSTIVGVSKGDFTLEGKTLKTYVDNNTDNGAPVKRMFCGDCGSPIYSVTSGQPDLLFLKSGTLDDTSGLTPQFHIWCDSKVDWFEVPDGVQAVAKQ